MTIPAADAPRCDCGNRLSIMDTAGKCLECQERPKIALPGFTCPTCGEPVKAYKSFCGSCRRKRYLAGKATRARKQQMVTA